MYCFKRYLSMAITFLSLSSSGYAASLFELSETLYSISVTNGGKYNVFNSCKAMGQWILEWKISAIEPNNDYFLTIRSRDGCVRLFSATGEILNLTLFDGFDPFTSITLFNLQNFNEAAMPVKCERNATIMRYPVQVIIPANQRVTPGIYKCFLDIAIYNQHGHEIHLQTIQLAIEVDASQKLEIRSQELSAIQGKMLLDFGEVCAATTKKILLQVQSNIHYQLTAQSLNGSQLILSPSWQRKCYESLSIPYDCCCDGSRFILKETPQKISSGTPNKKTKTSSHHFSITLYPDPKKQWEGVYEDEILFSLKPIY